MVIHWFVGCMMKEREISVVPAGGYSSGKCGSLKERIWLAYLDKIHMEEEGDNFVPITSRYCSGVGQHRVGNFVLDGFRTLPNGGRGNFMNSTDVIIMDVVCVMWTDLKLYGGNIGKMVTLQLIRLRLIPSNVRG